MRKRADNWGQQLDRHFKTLRPAGTTWLLRHRPHPYPSTASPSASASPTPESVATSRRCKRNWNNSPPQRCSPTGLNLSVAATAGLTDIGIHQTTDHSAYAALLGGIFAACLTSLYEGWQTYRGMNQAANDAETRPTSSAPTARRRTPAYGRFPTAVC